MDKEQQRMRSMLKEQWIGIRQAGAELFSLLCAATLVFAVLIALGPLAQGLGNVASYM